MRAAWRFGRQTNCRPARPDGSSTRTIPTSPPRWRRCSGLSAHCARRVSRIAISFGAGAATLTDCARPFVKKPVLGQADQLRVASLPGRSTSCSLRVRPPASDEAENTEAGNQQCCRSGIRERTARARSLPQREPWPGRWQRRADGLMRAARRCGRQTNCRLTRQHGSSIRTIPKIPPRWHRCIGLSARCTRPVCRIMQTKTQISVSRTRIRYTVIWPARHQERCQERAPSAPRTYCRSWRSVSRSLSNFGIVFVGTFNSRNRRT